MWWVVPPFRYVTERGEKVVSVRRRPTSTPAWPRDSSPVPGLDAASPAQIRSLFDYSHAAFWRSRCQCGANSIAKALICLR
jgi:hypothetical protein